VAKLAVPAPNVGIATQNVVDDDHGISWHPPNYSGGGSISNPNIPVIDPNITKPTTPPPQRTEFDYYGEDKSNLTEGRLISTSGERIPSIREIRINP
jgi:hypothetical protein